MNSLEGTKNRRRDLDVIREWIVGCLVLFHTARIFDDLGGFYIKSETTHWVFNILNMLALQVGMPLAFVIAGYGICNSLSKRSSKMFIKERIKRLVVPFVFGILVIIPPQVFYQFRVNPNYTESYWEYYKKFFDLVPVWNFPWFFEGSLKNPYFHRGNAWFLYELLVFSLLCLPLFKWLLSNRDTGKSNWIENLNKTLFGIILLGLPIGIIEAAFKTDYAGGWCKSSYIPFLIYGFLLACFPKFRLHLKNKNKLLIIAAIITFILGVYSYFKLSSGYGLDPLKDYTFGAVAFRIIKGINGWLMVAMIWSFIELRNESASKASKKTSESLIRFERYAHGALLPFYLIHETILVVVAFYVVNWSVNIFMQYLIICLITYILTIAAYEVLIRRFKISRFLFGMKKY